MTIIIIFISILSFAILCVSWILSSILLKPKVIPYETLLDREIKLKRLDKSWFDELDKEEFFLESRYGYKLSCMLLNNDKTKERKTNGRDTIQLAILCHGYTSGKFGMMIYAKLLLKRGITVLLYDHRNHGMSDKNFTSMGYYEKFDLQTILDWSFERFGTKLSVLTYGESMGAATVLSHLSIDERVKCVIADCPFSDLEDLLEYQLKAFYHLPKFPFLPIATLIVRLRAGFWIKDVSPINGVKQSNTAIMFIHSIGDGFIPCRMTEEMYAIKPDKKDLFLAKEGGHAQSCERNPSDYEFALNHFLDTYY